MTRNQFVAPVPLPGDEAPPRLSLRSRGLGGVPAFNYEHWIELARREFARRWQEEHGEKIDESYRG